MNKHEVFKILGTDADATLEETRHAYLVQVKRWHPDCYPHESGNAAEKDRPLTVDRTFDKATASQDRVESTPSNTPGNPDIMDSIKCIGVRLPTGLHANRKTVRRGGVRRFGWRRLSLISAIIMAVCACASQRPVLYPNGHLYAVGPTVAEQDIDQCTQLARTFGADSDQNERIAKNTAGGAAVGGAGGAAAGAVWGRPGRGAAAGAAGGAAAAMTRSILNSDEPDPTFRGFVEKCLRDKGYAPIGWK